MSRSCPCTNNTACPTVINNSCGGTPVTTAATLLATCGCGCQTQVCNTCLVPSPTTDHAYAVSLAPQTVCGGSDIPFDTNRTINGTALSHVQGNTDFVTLVPGNYHVRFTTTATPTAAGCPMGAAASVAIALNGQPIAGSTVTETAVLNQQVSLATQAIVTVNCGEVARISVRNMSASQTIFVDPSITIVRLS